MSQSESRITLAVEVEYQMAKDRRSYLGIRRRSSSGLELTNQKFYGTIEYLARSILSLRCEMFKRVPRVHNDCAIKLDEHILYAVNFYQIS